MEAQTHSPLKDASFVGLIGVSREDITPPVGIYAGNWGAAKFDATEGIHRPLTITCHIFQSIKNEGPLVLISADLGWWKNFEDEKFLREGILEALSLESWQLMICLSHTHAGPSICRNDSFKPGGEFIEPYLRHIQKCAIKAIENALLTKVKATLTWHYGKCSLATNRDLPEKHKDRYVVGFNPNQQADDTLLVGRVTDEQNQLISTIVNYACHPTTLAWDNKLISPDYIGAMRETVELKTNVPCAFLQGASGELAPPQQYVGDCLLADTYGRQLGYAVLATLEAMLPAKMQLSFSSVIESGAPLAIWEQSVFEPSTAFSYTMVEVELPLKELPVLADIEQQWKECTDRVLKERLWRKYGVRKAVGDGETAKIPIWIWCLGDSFLIGQPNEAYSEFQTELRKSLRHHAVGVMNVANGHIGYLPGHHLYEHDIYSVWQTPFAKGSLELLIKAAANAAHQLIKK
jgi:hypothetical protein